MSGLDGRPGWKAELTRGAWIGQGNFANPVLGCFLCVALRITMVVAGGSGS